MTQFAKIAPTSYELISVWQDVIFAGLKLFD
jgi:hypothetical protein